MKRNNEIVKKSTYQKPQITLFGKVAQLTQKAGSAEDIGQPNGDPTKPGMGGV